MRKLACLLVLVFSVPAFAVVFTLSDDGGGGMYINYDLDQAAGEVLRGLALTVKVTAGDAVVMSPADVMTGPFNTFPDWAADVDNTYTAVGQGHPVAIITPDVTGGQYEASFPTSQFSLCMGYLDEAGSQAAVTNDGYIAVTFTGTVNSTVEVDLDTLRGGVVGDNITSVTGLPATFLPEPPPVPTVPTIVKMTPAPAASGYVNGGRVETFVASSTTGPGHALEYQFTWGDGAVGPWGPATQTHTYIYGGVGVVSTGYTYNVTVQARDVANPAIVSPISPVYAVTTEAVKSTAPFYSVWAIWNRPDCWACKYNCHGDVDCNNQLNRPVYTSDLATFKAAYGKVDSALVLVPNGICADINHAAQLSRRVYTADLGEFKLWYNKNVSLVPICDQTHYHYWTH